MIVPKGFIPDGGHRPAVRDDRGGAGHRRSTTWSQHQQAGRGRSSRRIRTSRLHVDVGGGSDGGGANQGRLYDRPQAARASAPSADEIVARAATEARAACRACACSCRIRRRSQIGGRRRRACISSRCRARTSRRSIRGAPQLERRMRGSSRASGRDERPADRESAGRPSRSTASAPAARRDGAARSRRAVRRVRSRQVSTIYTPNNEYWVVMELLPEYQQDVERSACSTFASTQRARSFRSSAVAKFDAASGPLAVNHSGQLPSVTHLVQSRARACRSATAVGRGAADGAARSLPAAITTGFSGTAQAFQRRSRGSWLLLVLAVFVIYVVLGMLYESFIHPHHDSLGLAVRGVRRAAHAADLRHRPRRLRLRRHHPAHRHREEERDHDDRLRARGASAAEGTRRRTRSSRRRACASGRS